MKRYIEPIEGVKGFKVSVVEWSENEYTLAVLREEGHNFVVVDNVPEFTNLEAHSPMEVYGIINRIIRPVFF